MWQESNLRKVSKSAGIFMIKDKDIVKVELPKGIIIPTFDGVTKESLKGVKHIFLTDRYTHVGDKELLKDVKVHMMSKYKIPSALVSRCYKLDRMIEIVYVDKSIEEQYGIYPNDKILERALESNIIDKAKNMGGGMNYIVDMASDFPTVTVLSNNRVRVLTNREHYISRYNMLKSSTAMSIGGKALNNIILSILGVGGFKHRVCNEYQLFNLKTNPLCRDVINDNNAYVERVEVGKDYYYIILPKYLKYRDE